MNLQGAYGDSSRKRALLNDVRDSGPVSTLWLKQAFEADLDPISRDFALHPTYVKLLAAIAGFGQSPDSWAFLETALETLPVGSDTGRLARQILLLAWTHPEFGVVHVMANGPERQACEVIIGLVTNSLDTPQDRKVWRSARSALARAQAEAGGDDTMAGIVLSMAWDLDEAPGAALDVVLSWSSVVMMKAYDQDPDILSAEERELHMAALSRFTRETMADLGEIQQGDEAAYAKYRAMLAEKWTSAPELQALNSRVAEQQARVASKGQAWRKALQENAILLTRAAAVFASDPH